VLRLAAASEGMAEPAAASVGVGAGTLGAVPALVGVGAGTLGAVAAAAAGVVAAAVVGVGAGTLGAAAGSL